MKKSIFLYLAFFLLAIFMISCEDEKEQNEQNSQAVSLSTNIKNSAVFFDLETKSEVKVADLVFSKASLSQGAYPIFYISPRIIKLNDAKSYEVGPFEACSITRTDLTDLNLLTAANYLNYELSYDTLVGRDWYIYNFQTHTLSPKPQVYLLKNSYGNYVKFKISKYSNSNGEMTISYSILYSDSTEFSKIDSLRIPLPSDKVYLSFQKGIFNEIRKWDLKFAIIPVQTPIGTMKYPGVLLNSANGTMAAFVDNVNYDVVNPSDYQALLKFDSVDNYAIGTNFFRYDQNTHKLSPYDNRVFIIKSSEGELYKMKAISYYNSFGKSGFIVFEYKK